MLFKYIWFFVVLLFCWSCAQQGSPSGGPRDEDSPVPLETDPPNYSTRFESKKIYITFDEYIVLDNVNQQLIVSPPMEEKPEVTLRKKTLIIEFEEALRINTTYTFNFGDAIKDLHEGNKLQNYEYVFSTGDVLDSLSLKGTLKYAENLEAPEEPFSIMLYSDLRDSVPLIDIPFYVGRSNDSGVFSVNNLRPDVYKVFALKDANNNFLFDLPTEEIAFLDSSLIVNADFARRLLGDTVVPVVVPDTIIADSTGMAADSIVDKGPDLNAIYIDLMLFTEEPEIQYLTDYSREDRRKLLLTFARPLTDTFFYHFLQEENEKGLTVLDHFSSNRDSLTLWVKDSLQYKRDSLFMEVGYTIKDTSDQYVIRKDTLLFSYKEQSSRNKRGQAKEKEEEKLAIHTIRNNANQELNLKLPLVIDFPLDRIQDTLISLYHIPDSLELAVPFVVKIDSTTLGRASLSASWESAANYRLVALPGAISSIYSLEHDTIDVKFSTRDLEYYGQILLSLENVKDRVMIQLFSGNKMLGERTIVEDGQYVFPFLAPKEYSFKFIHDLNGNGKWDTGKYMEKLQPEPVELLPVKIEVRSNWDHDVTMKLEK